MRPPPRPRPSPKPKTKYILVIFGDSTSDTGNDFKAAGVPDATIYTGPGVDGPVTGRFSNGYNWVDYLSFTVAKKNPVQVFNYAHGGATACANALMETGFPFVKNLTTQTQLFLNDLKSGKIVVDSHTRVLVIQWIGTVDFLIPLQTELATGQLPNASSVASLVQATVGCRLAGIQALAQLTGIVTDIAVLPMAPLHIFPELPSNMVSTVIGLEDVVGLSTTQALARLQETFNKAPPGTPGYGVKLHAIGTTAQWMADIAVKIQPPLKDKYGFCFVKPVSSLVITPGVTTCSNPNDHFFFDTQHITSRVGEWLANKSLLPKLRALKLLLA